LNILSPIDDVTLGGGTVQVSAQLVRNPIYANTTVFPDTLSFGVTRAGGGTVGSFGSVTRTDATYTISWTPPHEQARFTLSAAHPEPAVGLSDTVNVTVDALAPDLTVVVPTAQVPASSGGFTYGEPDMAPAWRRDQVVEVRVESNAADLDPASLQVVVRGHNGGTDVTDLTLEPCQGSPANFCRKLTVPLSRPGLEAFNGSFTVEATARDMVGNAARDTGTIPVTRWKWAFDGAAGAIRGTPAIGNGGIVYFGTFDSSGKLFALHPGGTLRWEAPLGQVAGSPTVGATRTSGEEYVYVAAKNASGTILYALRGSDKSQVARCPGAVSFGTSLVESAMALGTSVVDPGSGVINAETAVGIYNSSPSRIIGIRPDAQELDQCINIVNTGIGGPNVIATPPTMAGASLVLKDDAIFFGANPTAGPRLTSYSFASGSNSPRANWPVTASHVPWGLALLDDKVYGGQASVVNPPAGSLFSAPQSVGAAGTSVSVIYPMEGTARVFGLAIGNGRFAYFGTESAEASGLARLALDAPPNVQSASSTATIRATPVLGQNDRLYTVATDGRVSAWAANPLRQLWSTSLAGASGVDVSPTLDCNRDNTGNVVPQSPVGMLYVAAGTSVYSFIVDSPGMDPSAPWPKYQHDARNTGNPVAPVTNCLAGTGALTR
jgi:outer membrane protein assembly factor BamB